MNSVVTEAIVLRRTDYGEADRIVVVLTPENGKISFIAKGVRRLKSKLAGGVELFSISNITFRPGKGELGTLVSARLETNFREITKDIDRVQLGYELIRVLNKITEDDTDPDYFELLKHTLASLDDVTIHPKLIEGWFFAQLLRLDGRTPNLVTDSGGEKLHPDKRYRFAYEDSYFNEHPSGEFDAARIKFLRLLFAGNHPKTLQQVQGIQDFLSECIYVPTALFRREMQF